MLAVKSMDVRENFKSLCDKVFRGETLIVSRPKNENIVMMSESEYNEIMKAKRNAEYLAMLDKSMAEAEAGGFITKTVDANLYKVTMIGYGGNTLSSSGSISSGTQFTNNECSIYSDCMAAVHGLAEGR